MDPVSQALVFLDANQPDRARELLRSALTQNPADGRAHIVMARAELQSGHIAAAEQHARAASADPATRALGLATLARIVGFDKARYLEAVHAASAAVQLDPQDWNHRGALALALADLRDFPNAFIQAQAAIQLSPNDPSDRARALMVLGRVYLADPANRERGYRVMRDAASLDPTDPAIQQKVMLAQFQSGRRAEAIRTALHSLRVTPTAGVPPLIARVSVYLLVQRVLLWSLLVTVAVPLLAVAVSAVFIAVDTSLDRPYSLDPELTVRCAGAAGVLAIAAVVVLTLRPLRDRVTLRAAWRFARRSALAWSALIALALAVLCYAGVLVLGVLFFPGVPAAFLILLAAWIVHSVGAFALRVPDAATLLASQYR